jgi:hypothetical protein
MAACQVGHCRARIRPIDCTATPRGRSTIPHTRTTLLVEDGREAGHHRGERGVVDGVKRAHGEAKGAFVGGEQARSEHRHRASDQASPRAATGAQQRLQVHRDDDEEGRVEGHEGVGELQHGVAARPQDQVGRRQQLDAAQPGVGEEREHEDGGHGEERGGGAESPGSLDRIGMVQCPRRGGQGCGGHGSS